MNASTLLAELEVFLRQRKIDVEQLTAEPMVLAMLDWFRFVAVDTLAPGASGDALVYRYGGWSEGCATGFKLSLLRRVTRKTEDGSTDWVAGITLMFEPSRFADTPAFSTDTTQWRSAEAFLHAIESSPAYKRSLAVAPMGAMVESGGFR